MFRRKVHKTVVCLCWFGFLIFVFFIFYLVIYLILKPEARSISRLLFEISPNAGEPSPASSSYISFFFFQIGNTVNRSTLV